MCERSRGSPFEQRFCLRSVFAAIEVAYIALFIGMSCLMHTQLCRTSSNIRTSFSGTLKGLNVRNQFTVTVHMLTQKSSENFQ